MNKKAKGKQQERIISSEKRARSRTKCSSGTADPTRLEASATDQGETEELMRANDLPLAGSLGRTVRALSLPAREGAVVSCRAGVKPQALSLRPIVVASCRVSCWKPTSSMIRSAVFMYF
jgi:hypothetical protein